MITNKIEYDSKEDYLLEKWKEIVSTTNNKDPFYSYNLFREFINEIGKQRFENFLFNKSNHQLDCMLECYVYVIANRIGFERETKQLIEIASKLK